MEGGRERFLVPSRDEKTTKEQATKLCVKKKIFLNRPSKRG